MRIVLPDVVSTRVIGSVIVRFLINANSIDPDVCENLWGAKVPVFYTPLDLCKSKLKLALAGIGVGKFVRDSETSFIQEANDLLWSFLALDIKLGDPVAMPV